MNNLPDFLETDHLTLKPLTDSNVNERYVSWLNDSEVNQYLESRFVTQTINSCLSFVNNCNQDPNTYLFGVFTKNTSEHIGNCKLGFIETVHKKAHIGLIIGEKKYWSKGFGKEIIMSLTEFAFKHIHLERLEAGCYEENLASLYSFLSCGYQIDGLLRNSVISHGNRTGLYSLGILKSDINS